MYTLEQFLEIVDVMRYVHQNIAKKDAGSKEQTLKILFDFFDIPWRMEIVEVITNRLVADSQGDWAIGYGYAIAFDCYREEMEKWPLRPGVPFAEKCRQLLDVFDGWIRLPNDIRERLIKKDRPL